MGIPNAAIELPKRVSTNELALILDCAEKTLRYRIKHGQMTRPDDDGLLDLERARAEFARKPKQKRRPKGPTMLSNVSAAPADTPDAVDADKRYRMARAEREELSVEKLRGELEPKTSVARSQERFSAVERSVIESIPSQWTEEIAAEVECEPRRLRLALERMSRATLAELEKRARGLAEKARTP